MDEREFNKQIGLRYELDYRIVPKLLLQFPAACVNAMLAGDAASMLSAIYNDVFEGKEAFTAADFRVERYMDEDDFIYYINTPAENDSKLNRCIAYGFAFVRDGDQMAAQFLLVEHQNDNDKFICGVDTNMDRIEFCDASGSDAENAKKMLHIAKFDKKYRDIVRVNF
jgi:hypothetical protein